MQPQAAHKEQHNINLKIPCYIPYIPNISAVKLLQSSLILSQRECLSSQAYGKYSSTCATDLQHQ